MAMICTLVESARQLSRISNLKEINIESIVRLCAVEFLKARALGKEKESTHIKMEILKNIVEKYSKTNESLLRLLSEANNIMTSIRKTLEEKRYDIIDIPIITKTRLLIGLSEQSFTRPICDLGLSWDPYLNLPYIPASTLKGALRSYMERSGLTRKQVDELLGSHEEGLKVVFVDSYPIHLKDRLLTIEVTTPIYQEQKGTIREHEARPVPIHYIAVEKGVTFRLIVGIRDIDPQKRELINKFILETLKEGIGAKTLLGYGIL
ncbi:MAG: type III-B CRISPR module RAMP protein Cmr6, partial [Crenarchaeota archaeon]|nr:type III-B CRISPR module RAMP protein Cmr6 [Thermoproteota archaeon]